jgi:iron(III) transport system permease protein
MALAVTMLILTFSIVVFQWKLIGKKDYTTITGRGYRATTMDLGRGRWFAFAFVLTFIIVSTLLPLSVLVWVSFMKIAGVFMADMYTLQHYKRAFSDPTLWTSLKNTLIMATTVATVGIVLCALVSYVVVKTKFLGRRLLDLIVWIPWAVPSVVLALGFLWAYLFIPLPFRVYGTLLLLILVLITKGFPLGTRTLSSVIVQISSELEESARIHGASWLQTFLRIVLPLLSRGLIAGWILLFAFSVKDVATVIMLYSAESTVISTQIFDWWNEGAIEVAIILGLIEAVLIGICFVVAQMLAGKLGEHGDK